MAKDYWIKFGSADSRTNTGLTPTFVVFHSRSTTLAPPGISEVITGTGMYCFTYGATQGIVFQVDGGAGLATSDRYVSGALDPIQAVDEKVGYITDSFGSTSVDPSSALGYLKRVQEFLEGNAVFTKSTGVWTISSRGSSTLLKSKTLTDTASTATKS